MKTLFAITILAGNILACTTLACFSAQAAEKQVAWEKLPPVVQKAMLEEAKGAKIVRTTTEVEDGKRLWECATLVNGKTRDFDVDATGKILEVEEEIGLAEAPAPVRAAAEKAAGKGKVTKLEAALREGKVTGYEATILSGGKKREVGMQPDGTLTK